MKGSTKDICASHLSEDLARAENNFYTLYYARGFLINHQSLKIAMLDVENSKM